METNSTSIFEELESQIVLASQGKRFLNYLIDVLVFYGVMMVIGMVFGILGMDAALNFLASDEPGNKLLSSLFSILLYALITGATEAIFKGKTLGKLITGTKAVNEDGSTISAATAFKRGFSRAVPFCAFSALGNPSYPWQDRWTNTYVMDEKRSQMNTIE
ncbi:RDD family protein [Taibaiella lutea]|uniref:RDD family protein n=1 Tax=Taibaiella lutea TaxID=2608001 RepID=A0A5M6CNP9_9BACT|nr:RDD family protein [Taibaiella lutea]KAA5536848.1 RDD family protein [Taibaiella lutea]